MKKISIIIPCYNEEPNVKKFFQEANKYLKNINYIKEFIFVNDGSTDNTLMELKKLLNSKEIIKIINFSKNFGKESAIFAGLKNCSGDYAVLIDADLQQHPKLINQMIWEIEADKNIDIVAYYQESRIENKVVCFLKKMFYKVINRVTGLKFKDGASDFRLFKKNVIDAILSFNEQNRFQKGIFAYIGFNTKFLPYVPEKRNAGKTSWNLIKLLKYAFSGILSFSNYPLRISCFFSIIEFITSVFLLAFCLVTGKLNSNIILIIILLALFSALQMSLSVISSYLYRSYNEVRNRPLYFVKEILNNENNKKSI